MEHVTSPDNPICPVVSNKTLLGIEDYLGYSSSTELGMLPVVAIAQRKWASTSRQYSAM